VSDESITNIRESDIAIVGMACRFPGAENVEAFWKNLRDGVESISFFSDDEVEVDNPELLRKPNYVKAGSVLRNLEKFDAAFFGYGAKEAEQMDPQQRLFLECAWEAFEDAGYNPETYAGLVGVYAGSGMNTYLVNNVLPHLDFSHRRTFLQTANDLKVRIGNSSEFLPTRISYKMNLQGPSVNVQTACSTSLVAIHMACQSLLNAECDIALAGGIAACVPQKAGYLYQEEMIWSPDGHCRAFDAAAQGTVFGNGSGIVALKLLSEAIAAGDNIHAVLKGTAINNDGAGKVGFTAPSVAGQATIISEALAVAEIDADTVSYVEAHGTGTTLGDPIEIEALTQAFRLSTEQKEFCAIGTVKTNIGHLAEAAGIAGLIKTVLALKHQQIPPSLNFSKPNPNIDFANSPFYVNTDLADWERGNTPRRAGVSSFGMGGTNAHVILEEAPPCQHEAAGEVERAHLFTLSARNERALRALAEQYIAYLATDSAVLLDDICFTVNTGRKHFKHRLAVMVTSKTQLSEQLTTFVQSGTGMQESNQGRQKIAFLFTGQGSQYAGMGQTLYEAHPIFRQTIDRCDELLRDHLDVPLLSVLYPDLYPSPINAQVDLIDQTIYTQPALFALEYALYQLWHSWGIEPDVVMGHSVGEYVAACVAGVFSLEDGLHLMVKRGQLIGALPAGGAMVSVMASEAQLAPLIESYASEVSMGAINGPQSIVLSGQHKTIASICAKLETEGVKTKKLNVSHAFHSPLMEPICAEFELAVQQIRLSPAQIPLISNLSGKLITDEVMTPEYWSQHIRQPVRFSQSMHCLQQQGVDIFLEMGPLPLLLGMGRHCLPNHDGLWLPSLRTGQDDWQQLLTSLAPLYMQGAEVNWLTFYQHEVRRRVHLPTYPFQRQRYWIEPPDQPQMPATLTSRHVHDERHHPLLGQPLRLAGTEEIRFESQIDLNRPSLKYLADHRIFQTVLLPMTAYVEMALAAGEAVLQATPFVVEELFVEQALMLSPEEDKSETLQCVLNPETSPGGADSYALQIFSLLAEASSGQQSSWVRHTSAKVRAIRDGGASSIPLTDATVDLSVLQVQCPEPIDLETFYQAFQARSVDYGPTFRAVEKLWRGEGQVLGQVQLPEGLVGEAAKYQLHPAFLDACLHTLGAIFPPEVSYLPIMIESLHVFRRAENNLWSHGVIVGDKDIKGNNNPERDTLKAEVVLFNQRGERVALASGLVLKRANPQRLEPSLDLSNHLYQVAWQPQARPIAAIEEIGRWLILTDRDGIGHQLAQQLSQRGHHTVLVSPAAEYKQHTPDHYQINPAEFSHFQRLLDDHALPWHGVIHLWGQGESVAQGEVAAWQSLDSLQNSQLESCGSVLHLVQALVKSKQAPRLWLVTRGAQPVDTQTPVQVQQAPLWGLAKAIVNEHPELRCVCLDLDPSESEWETASVVAQLYEELLSSNLEGQVAYHQGSRYVARLKRFRQIDALSSEVARDDSSYLITGGLGGLGFEVARWLVAQGARYIVLTSRRGITSQSAQQAIDQLETQGATVTVIRADVASHDEVASVLQRCQTLAPLRGIIHAAGVLDDGVLQKLSLESLQRVMAPKVAGAWNLHNLTADLDLDFFVCFSSGASIIGTTGQGNYMAANAFLDTLAHHRRILGLPGLTINWGAWSEIGMAAQLNQHDQRRLVEQGLNFIPPQAGLQTLGALIRQNSTQVAVLPINWSKWHRIHGSSAFYEDFAQREPGSTEPATFRRQLASRPVHEQRQLLVQHVRAQVTKTLGIHADQELDANQKLFDVGLDSLMAIELRSHLQASLELTLPSTLLFDHPTVTALVGYLAEDILSFVDQPSHPSAIAHIGRLQNARAGHDPYRSTLVPIQPDGSKPPFFCVPGILGSVFEFYRLAHYLGEKQPFYALRSLGLDEDVTPYTTLAEIADHHIRAMQTVQPQGPYFLGGHSFGGKVVFEIAQRLRDQGHEVSLLAIMDIQAMMADTEQDVAHWDDARYVAELTQMYARGFGEPVNFLRETTDTTPKHSLLGQLQKQLKTLGQSLSETETRRILNVYKANMQAMADYKPLETYPIPLTLLRAQQIHAQDNFLPNEAATLQDATWGWNDVSAEAVELHVVPGDHFTMMSEPHVQVVARVLAQQLKTCLATAHNNELQEELAI